ncbi:MAG: hypothetical protein CMJ23_01010 [Phycisphaerae bacterium]|nr:hypothetical protein [Phycisphaerae bacterium]
MDNRVEHGNRHVTFRDPGPRARPPAVSRDSRKATEATPYEDRRYRRADGREGGAHLQRVTSPRRRSIRPR